MLCNNILTLVLFPIPGTGCKELSVDWGRVVQNNPNGDILISLLSDNGSSGGPVVDREGQVCVCAKICVMLMFDDISNACLCCGFLILNVSLY